MKVNDLIDNWLGLIQLGKDGYGIIMELAKRIDEVANTEEFYNLPIHFARQILSKTPEINCRLAIKIIDNFTRRIGAESISLINYLRPKITNKSNLISVLQHFTKSHILNKVISELEKTNDLEEDGIQVDYKHKCQMLEKQINELKQNIEDQRMKIDNRVKITPKPPTAQKKTLTTLPKTIRTTVEDCVSNNDAEALRYLLSINPEKINETWNRTNYYYINGFIHSVFENKEEFVEIFLQHGKQDLNQIIRGNDGSTCPAWSLIEYKNPRIAFVVYKYDETIKTAMQYSFEKNNLEFVKELIEKDGKDPNDSLKYITNDTKPEIIDYLLSKGLNPNSNFQNTNSPLIFSLHNHMKSLLEHGADPNAVNNEGKTPLFYAYDAKKTDMLINAGANIAFQAKDGKTILFEDYMGLEAFDLLLKHGADLNGKYNGKSVLNYFIEKSNIPKVRILLEYGALPDDQTDDSLERCNENVRNLLKDIIRRVRNANPSPSYPLSK